MAVCVECKRDNVKGYHRIQTKRGSQVVICKECMAKYQRKEVDSASNNRKPIR